MKPDDNTRFEFLCKAAGFEKPTDLPVWKWECQEALSQPYRLLIDLAVPHAHVQNRPYQKLLGARGTFRVMNSEQTPWNQWQGLITAVHMTGVESVQTNDRETSLYLYLKVELEPQFVLLRQETTSRVHVLPEQDNVRQLSMLIRDAMKRADLRTERMLGMPRDGNPDDHADYAIALGSRTDSWQGKDFFFQYKETTLDFLSRHLEHRGAYYRFDQSDSDKETILFCDDTTGLPPDEDIQTANWQAKASLIPDSRASFLHHFAQHHAISPRTISIDEFNPNDTKLKLQLSKQVNEDATTSPENPYASWGSLNLSGDGYRKQSDGETLLEHYRQEQICRQNQYQAKGLIRDLHAGSVFTLQGHALPEFNQRYRVTHIQYRGEQPLPYDTKTETSARLWSEFSVLPAGIAFRPERLTPRPHIPGLLHAIIEAEEQPDNSPGSTPPAANGTPRIPDSQNLRKTMTGEKSADALGDTTPSKDTSKVADSNDPNESWVKPYLSKEGYYRIRFLCTDNAVDLPENRPAKNSAWVRMATPYAGTTNNQDGEFGMYFPLKAGTEVLVAFMDGDPDEPIIVASVPNSSHRALSNYDEKKKNTSGFVMPGGNMLTFVNKESNKTALLFSPIADSFMLLGGDLDVSGHQGILIHSQGHITTKADSEKKIVDGKGFSRAYDLNVGEGAKAAAKAASPEKNFVEKSSKFAADWLHPDSGASFSISKPKVSFGAEINPFAVNFALKVGTSVDVKATASFAIELSAGKTINLLERQTTKKKEELKIQQREVTAIKDTLTVGERTETVLSHTGKYGVYSASTKAMHLIEAEGGILVSAVSKIQNAPDNEVSKKTLGEADTASLASIILDALNPVKIAQAFKKNFDKLRKKELDDLPPVKLENVIKNAKTQKLRPQDVSYLGLHQKGLALHSNKTVSIAGEEGFLNFSKQLMVTTDKWTLNVGSMSFVWSTSGVSFDAGSKGFKMNASGNQFNMASSGLKIASSAQTAISGALVKLG